MPETRPRAMAEESTTGSRTHIHPESHADRISVPLDPFESQVCAIAHDLNNLLTVIIAYSDLLSQSVGVEAHALIALGEISRAGERAASLTRQLLAFSHDPSKFPGGSENILLVEDERVVHELSRQILEKCGCSVVDSHDYESPLEDCQR